MDNKLVNIPKQTTEDGPTPAWMRNDHQMIVQLTSGVASGYLMAHIEVNPQAIVDIAINLAWEIHKREQGIP